MKFPAHFINRLIVFTAILSFNTFQLNAQKYKEMIEAGNATVSQIQDSANAYFLNRDKGKGSGYVQYKRWEYMASRLMNEEGKLQTQDYFIQEWEQANARNFSQVDRRDESRDFWEDLGPTYWNATSGWNPGVGRLTCFSIEKGNPSHIIVGAESGGVWKTTDGGQNWTPLCDFFSNMHVYSTAMHPAQSQTYYFGSNGGRVYKSTDGGKTWTALTQVGNSNINKILIHPNNPDRIFVSVQNSGAFRTDNGGNSWTRITGDPRSYDIEFKPGDLQTVYASGNQFHVSQDGGITFTQYQSSGSQSPFEILSNSPVQGGYNIQDNAFTSGSIPIPSAPNGIQAELALFDGDANYRACSPHSNSTALAGKIAIVTRGDCNFTDKVIHAQNAGALAVIVVNNTAGLMSMGGGNAQITIPAVMIEQAQGQAIIAELQNQVTLMAKLERNASSALENGPKMIGISADKPNRVYLLEASGSRFGALYISENSGQGFERINHGSLNFFGYSTVGNDNSGQAPRDMAITVNPFNADEVHIAGILTWRSLNAGRTFDCTSDWVVSQAASKNIGYCHADIDFMDFYDSILYVATDGGLFYAPRTRNLNRNYFVDITEGLRIRQFYKIGISQTSPTLVSGGSQDNGTSLLNSQGNWIDWLGADGMETFIDKDNPAIVYGTSQFGRPYRSDNEGLSYTSLLRPGSQSGRWVTPFEQDPMAPNTLYIGYEQVFKSVNRGVSWNAISQTFPSKLDHLKIAASNNDIMLCSYAGNLFKTHTGGGEWYRLTGFTGNVNSIAIHPTNPHIIAIATTAQNRVFVSTDGGETWEVYRKNLPNFSALALVWDQNPDTTLYLGMNYGIYYIHLHEDEWTTYNTNLPNVIINELEIHNETQLIYAATYGRGLWVSKKADYNLDRTGISEPNQSFSDLINVYPNPASGVLHIEATQIPELKGSVEMYNGQGQLVRVQKNADFPKIDLDVTTLTPGIYYLKVGSTQGTCTFKVMIQ